MNPLQTPTPRAITTPNRRIPLQVPEGMSRIEFLNSPGNLRNLTEENGLLRTQEGFLLYRKLLGHSMEFDTSIILDTSNTILNPLGRPVRRDELTAGQKCEWSRMTLTILQYMLERYPDPEQHLLLCGEASLDPTWPLNKPGVPSIRMIHNHFMVFPKVWLREAPRANLADPNLTDGGHTNLFLGPLAQTYQRFFASLGLTILVPMAMEQAQLALTGYPMGLPSWEVQGGASMLATPRFWQEYDLILKGFLDFYRTFFALVSTHRAELPTELHFPNSVAEVLLFNNDFFAAAKAVRERIVRDPEFANHIRWKPAYKQILYRDDHGRLVVTISPNSVGNAITELLGVVVNRVEDDKAYAHYEPALVAKLLEVRDRLIAADLGEAITTSRWPGAQGDA